MEQREEKRACKKLNSEEREKSTQWERGEKKRRDKERKKIKRGNKVGIRNSVDSNKPFWVFCKRKNKKLNQQSEF